jgi:hypothetical protein
MVEEWAAILVVVRTWTDTVLSKVQGLKSKVKKVSSFGLTQVQRLLSS